MIDSYFRNPFQKYGVDGFLENRWIKHRSPLFFTFTSLIFGFVSFLCLVVKLPLLAILFLFISGYCDVLDGSQARKTNQTSESGAALDLIFDRIVEFLILVGLYLQNNERAFFIILMLGSIYLCVTSFFIVGLFSKNESKKSFHYSPGLIERTEAFTFFALMIFLPEYFYGLSITFSILTLLTAFWRIFEFIKEQKGHVESHSL